jgi:hypothetical protein
MWYSKCKQASHPQMLKYGLDFILSALPATQMEEMIQVSLAFHAYGLLRLRRNLFWSWLQIRLSLVTRNEVHKYSEEKEEEN